MVAINTNVGALLARKDAVLSDNRAETHIRRLSSGLRLNGASDGAGELGVVNNLRANLRGINVGIKNSYDAISLLETADAGVTTAQSLVQRMRELAVQMSNAIYTNNDRLNAHVEFAALATSITALSNDTMFNGDILLDGSLALTMRIGDNATQTLTVIIDDAGSGAITTVTQTISTMAQAKEAVGTLDTAIVTLANNQADIGSFINRLTFHIEAASSGSVAMEKAVGRMADTDYAKETALLAREQILNQAATAILAQANASKNNILQTKSQIIAKEMPKVGKQIKKKH